VSLQSQNRFVRLGCYIVSMDLVHGAVNLGAHREDLKPQIVITYANSISACLDFRSQKEADEMFDKFSEALEAV